VAIIVWIFTFSRFQPEADSIFVAHNFWFLLKGRFHSIYCTFISIE
jgi:hypothetical protein